jgi:hypothetical protein
VGFKVRLSLLALVVGAFVVCSAPAAQAAETPEIQTLVAVNCTVEKCAQTEQTIPLEPYSPELEAFFGPQTYVEPAEPSATESEEQGFLQAGGRVPYGVTDFKIATEGALPFEKPTSVVEHLRTDVAPGLATDPIAVPYCSATNYGVEEYPGSTFFTAPKCATSGPGDTQVGKQRATVSVPALGNLDLGLEGKVYNLEPEEGLASEYGVSLPVPIAISKGGFEKYFGVLEALKLPVPDAEEQEEIEEEQWYAHTLIKGSVEWGKQAKGTDVGDYHDYFEIEVSPELPLVASRLDFEGTNGEGDFVTNATSCPGHNTTTLKMIDKEKVAAKPVEYTTPIGLHGCSPATETDKFGTKFTKELAFEPKIKLTSGSTVSDQPNEISTEISETHSPKAIDPSQVKTASITLPEGMTLNPSAAYGLEACTVEQARIHSEEFGVACPSGSRVGTDTLDVPGLPKGSLTGGVYLGDPTAPSEQNGPIKGPPFVVYVVANSKRYGVSVRLKGEVFANEATGQLTTVFEENPEQPFDDLAIHFDRGMLTSIANPLICGELAGSASFSPVSGTPSATQAAFGVSVTGCAATVPFSLTQSTGYDNTTAGSHNAYTFNLARAEGQQYLQKIKTTLPSGLVGEIPDITLCGEPQAESGECGAASKIGTATVTDGSGSFPYTFTGPVYMTGPYKGAPFGLSIVVPAVAGPFNFGNVITRSTININQTTARVTAETTLPTIVKGVPLRLRSLSVDVNKQGFLLNPTSCSEEQTETTLTSTLGTLQEGLKSPLTAEGCSSLAFKPAFTASTSGTHSKTNGASLVTTITQPAGQANIKSVFVTLPKLLPSRLTTLQKACAAKTFEENPFNCRKEYEGGSEVGTAEAVSPTLPGVMKGPAFLVSHAGEEFPSLELVLEDDNVRVIVEGKTDIKNGITTTNFQSTPDVPVSSITVDLPMGPHSAVTTEQLNTNLCTAKLVMPTIITGQNGVVTKQNTVIAPTGCGVQIVGHKVVGNTAYITVETYAAGRISGSGKNLSTTRRSLTAASKAVTLKIPLTKKTRGRRRPFKVKLRVGFTPSQKGAASSSASVTVTFRR